MSTIINATTTNGVVIQPDNSGSLVLQTNSGTTALTIDTSQNVAFAKGFTVGATAAPAFSAYRTGTQSGISVSTLTKVQINTEVFDTNNNFDSTTNYRFTPTVAGYYYVTGHVGSPTLSTSTEILAAIGKNSTQITWGGTGSSKGGIYPESLTTTLVYLNGSTDYVELFVYGTGATFSLEGDQLNTYFQAFLARSA